MRSPTAIGVATCAAILLERADVERIGRLLDPGDVELLEAAAEPDRLGGREAAAQVEHQLDVGADRGTAAP